MSILLPCVKLMDNKTNTMTLYFIMKTYFSYSFFRFYCATNAPALLLDIFWSFQCTDNRLISLDNLHPKTDCQALRINCSKVQIQFVCSFLSWLSKNWFIALLQSNDCQKFIIVLDRTDFKARLKKKNW